MKIYYKNNLHEHHRDGDKPAIVCYDKYGFLDSETYFKNGVCHRDGDKPADIIYENSIVIMEKYFREGNYFRIKGPSKIKYNQFGQVIKKSYKHRPQ